jgi:GNAT superfamily N-acetyltransferase
MSGARARVVHVVASLCGVCRHAGVPQSEPHVVPWNAGLASQAECGMEPTAVSIIEAERDSLAEFAAVMVDAFATEGINAYAFDFSRGGTLRARRRAARVELRSFFESGDYLLVARLEGRIVGGAIVGRNAPQALRTRVGHTIRWMLVMLPLLPAVRWGRLRAVKRATSLSEPILGRHYTLVAVAVQPDYQGRGIGRALLQKVHAFSENDSDAVGMYLYTGDSKNRILYEGEGYEAIEVRIAGTLTVSHMFRTNGAYRMALDVNE